MIESIGYIGAILLAVCAVPQMVMSVMSGNSQGISHLFLWSWFLGEVFMVTYFIASIGPQGPVFYNYVANIVMLTVIIYYKYFPRG